jgi:hypothetical protein
MNPRIILLAVFALSGAALSETVKTSAPTNSPVILEKTLNPNQVIVVPTAPGLTTTLEFPRPIRAVDGDGISDKHDAEALFVASYTRGVNSKQISFSPLYTKARTNVNITIGDDVFVFVLLVDFDRALFKLHLTDPPPPPVLQEAAAALVQTPAERRAGLTLAPAQYLGMIDKCNAYALLDGNGKATQDLIQGSPPWPLSKGDGYEIQPLQVFRKPSWDALIFEVQITNTSPSKFLYNPLSFQVNAGGPHTFHAAFADAAGYVPPSDSVKAWFIIQGDGNQGSNNLAPNNKWLISVQPILDAKSAAPLPLLTDLPK